MPQLTTGNRSDIRRAAGGHPAFGHGNHRRLGASLAPLEGAVAFRTLLERCPDLALNTNPATLTWPPSLMLRGLHQLPVTVG